MKKFEYKRVNNPVGIVQMNQLGNEGWEFCSEAPKTTLFKRVKEDKK